MKSEPAFPSRASVGHCTRRLANSACAPAVDGRRCPRFTASAAAPGLTAPAADTALVAPVIAMPARNFRRLTRERDLLAMTCLVSKVGADYRAGQQFLAIISLSVRLL